MSNDFYVYEHWRPDRGECFYVGKGRGSRANNLTHGRNLHHHAIQVKLSRLGLPVEIKIIAKNLSCDEAFAMEIERIAFWRNDGADLVNMTDGGDGLRNPAASTRELIRKSKVGKKASAETRRRMCASHAKRPRQTAEQIEKARVNKMAKRLPTTDETRRKMSVARKKIWEQIYANPRELQALIAQRSATSRRMWTPERMKNHSEKMKRIWAERRAVKALESKE